MHLHLVPLIRRGLQFARIRRRASEDERFGNVCARGTASLVVSECLT